MAEKFEKIQDKVLYSIATRRKRIKVKELSKINNLEEIKIRKALASLEKRNLVIKYKNKKIGSRNGEIISFGLNIKKIERIKKIIGEHWESQWEEDWK